MKQNLIIATDKMFLYPTLFGSLGEHADDLFDVVTASSHENLKQIVSTLNPGLIVMRFSDYNLDAELVNVLKNVPILFLLRGNEPKPQFGLELNNENWFEDQIELCEHQRNYLKYRIQNILNYLKLKEEEPEDELMDEAAINKYLLEIERKNKVLEGIQKKLQRHLSKFPDMGGNEIRSIIYSIKSSLNQSTNEVDVNCFLEQEKFFNSIKDQYPKLTSDDLKYCYYLKMNFSNREIASQLSISPESVRTHKYRLKKKMTLTREDDLHIHIRGFQAMAS